MPAHDPRNARHAPPLIGVESVRIVAGATSLMITHRNGLSGRRGIDGSSARRPAGPAAGDPMRVRRACARTWRPRRRVAWCHRYDGPGVALGPDDVAHGAAELAVRHLTTAPSMSREPVAGHRLSRSPTRWPRRQIWSGKLAGVPVAVVRGLVPVDDAAVPPTWFRGPPRRPVRLGTTTPWPLGARRRCSPVARSAVAPGASRPR